MPWRFDLDWCIEVFYELGAHPMWAMWKITSKHMINICFDVLLCRNWMWSITGRIAGVLDASLRSVSFSVFSCSHAKEKISRPRTALSPGRLMPLTSASSLYWGKLLRENLAKAVLTCQLVFYCKNLGQKVQASHFLIILPEVLTGCIHIHPLPPKWLISTVLFQVSHTTDGQCFLQHFTNVDVKTKRSRVYSNNF